MGVLLVEMSGAASCEVAETFIGAGFTPISLWASYDFIFVSPKVRRERVRESGGYIVK